VFRNDHRTLSIAAVVLAATLSAFPQGAGRQRVFTGRIGESRVEMVLSRDGDVLTGSYSYVKVGKRIALAGKVGADGSFTLTETGARGVKTGFFKGKWSESGDDGAVTLTGEWRNPAGSRTLDFDLAEQMIFFSGAKRLTTRTLFENNKPKMFELSVEYPELSGVAPTVAAEFNRLARSRVMEKAESFRKDMLAQTADDLKWARERGFANTSEIGYSVTYADDELISISFGNYLFTGGAHGNAFTFPLNFDLRTGREIRLADVFAANSEYLQDLSRYCVKKLQDELNEGNEDEWIQTGAGPKAENFESWNVRKSGLMLTFDAYQVAPYAAGPQEVVVPFGELRSILRGSYRVFGLD
jgi:hypothetical protein